MATIIVQKIVSGGQTGVDRAALDVAIHLDIPHGGWCPRDRRAEDGAIPAIYNLQQTSSRKYPARTEQNVIDSDGTLILYRNKTTGGTELTCRFAAKHHRPLLCIDLERIHETDFIHVQQWLQQHNILVLNVAGPRESTCNGIAQQSEQFLVIALVYDDQHWLGQLNSPD